MEVCFTPFHDPTADVQTGELHQKDLMVAYIEGRRKIKEDGVQGHLVVPNWFSDSIEDDQLFVYSSDDSKESHDLQLVSMLSTRSLVCNPDK